MWHPGEVIHLFKNKELDELYVSIAVRRFALAIISIFLPIYFFEQGVALAAIFLFFAGKNIVHAMTVLLAVRICRRYGYKHSMVFSAPLVILFFILLYALDLTTWSLALLAIIHGFQTALYYTGYHLDFTALSKQTDTGRAIGIVKVLSTLVHAIGPVLGGISLALLGFHVTFIIVGILLLLSSVPLLLTKDGRAPMPHAKLSSVEPHMKRHIATFIGYGVEAGASQLLWPLYIYIAIVSSYTILGSIVSLGVFISVMVSWVIAHFATRRSRKLIRFGVFTTVIAWILRLLAKTSGHVYVADAIHGMGNTAITLPIQALTYEEANKTDMAKYIIMREVSIQLGRACLFLFAATVGLHLITLGIGAASTLLFLLI